jgi:tryptophanyl-tRNA synthetase
VKYVSGIRPTGHVHIGNYLGAIRQWKALQAAGNDCLFFIADLHGISTAEEIEDTLRALSGCGIHNLVVQGHHAPRLLKLAHDLSFHVPVGWLNRMTQFKDKSQTESANLALFSYPVLMAADILYHGATHVPIGDDQRQHLEFVRDLVDSLAAKDIVFTKPEPVLGEYPRIMSLKDGTRKMSKSDPDDDSRINLSDTPDQIRRKIMEKAKTSMSLTDDTPEVVNLKTIYRAFGGTQDHTRWKEFKAELVQLIVGELHSSNTLK